MIRKYWKKARYIVVPLAIIVVVKVFFSLLDVSANGVLADWFDRQFMYEYTTETASGESVLVRDIDWSDLKFFIYETFAFFALLVSLSAMIGADIFRRRERTKHSKIAAEYLQRYLIDESAVPVELPQEDAEIFSKINEVKLKISEQRSQIISESQRKNDLITYLAHDLKTPLTSVLGYLSLMNDEPEMSTKQRAKYTGIALKKAERLEELLDEIFEITRFDIASIELQKEEVNISGMLEQMISEFEPLLSEKSLSIEPNIENDLRLYCDVDKTERIIDNLIRNAVSYSFDNSVINILLKEENGSAVMRFENRGKTIPPDKLGRIFDRFYRADSSRGTSNGGSGLGLAIAKALTEAHGGSITAESREEKIRFTLTLPNCHKNV